MSAKTNVDGRYFMTKVPAGTYTVVVTAPYYKSSQVHEVVIVEGEAARLNVPLYNDSSDIVELESFKVQAKVLQESDVGLCLSGRRPRRLATLWVQKPSDVSGSVMPPMP